MPPVGEVDEEALAHPLLSSLHGLNSEPVASPFDFAFEAASDPELKLLLNAESPT